VESDNRLILHVIGAMVDMTLPKSVAPELAKMAEVAISVADEEDLPMLFRTLIKSLGYGQMDGDHISSKIRSEAAALPKDVLSLVVESLWEVLPSSWRASNDFLAQILFEQENDVYRTGTPPLSDVAIVIILVSDGCALRDRALKAISYWVRNGLFPFAQVKEILNMRTANEVWDRMIPSLWRLCLWLIDSFAGSGNSSSGGGSSGNSSSSSSSSSSSGADSFSASALADMAQGLTRIVASLYSNTPGLRDCIVAQLLQRCNTETHLQSSCFLHGGRPALVAALPPLGRSGRRDNTPSMSSVAPSSSCAGGSLADGGCSSRQRKRQSYRVAPSGSGTPKPRRGYTCAVKSVEHVSVVLC